MKNLTILFFLFLYLSAYSQTTKVKPIDNGKALNNPFMGWNLAYYTDDGTNYGNRLKKGDVLDWFPGCNTISFRIGWARIEKRDGIFDWSYTDSIAKYWIKQGKPAHLSVDFEAEEVHSLPCKDIAAAKKEAQRHADNLKL